MRRARSAAAIAVMAVASVAAPAAKVSSLPLGPGDVAPNFTKTALGGGSVSLSNYSGKVVLLFMLGYG